MASSSGGYSAVRVTGGLATGETGPPRSRTQPAKDRPLDVHETITLAPPAPLDEEQRAAPEPEPWPDGHEGRSTPPPVAGSNAQMQAALAASTRTDASLSGLMRAIHDLVRGVGGAREANEQLVRELETLREMLANANEQQLALKNRLALLEKEREQDRRRSASDRAYLTEQYDCFLAELLDDHEQVTEQLRREREAAEQRISELEVRIVAGTAEHAPVSSPIRQPAAPPEASDEATREELQRAKQAVERLSQERERTREALQRLQAQRDEAQVQAAKAGRQRDEAQAEADTLRGEIGRVKRMTSTRPPARQPGSVALSARRTDPPPKQAPLELDLESPSSPRRGAPATLASARASSNPPLRVKPDPSSRPLIGYSLRDSIAPESLGSSRTPKPSKT